MPERRVILSERAAMLSELIQLLKPGDEVEGVVTRTTDYGAFVSLVGSDGRMHGAEVRGPAWVLLLHGMMLTLKTLVSECTTMRARSQLFMLNQAAVHGPQQ